MSGSEEDEDEDSRYSFDANQDEDDLSDFSTKSEEEEKEEKKKPKAALSHLVEKQTNDSTATETETKKYTSNRNHGRSKMSTGTRAYMKKYPEQSTDGGLRLGNVIPDFEADTSQGFIPSFHEWKKGKFTVLFSHPSDFTPVCTTEIAAIALRYADLQKMDCLLIGLSVDPAESHREWMKDIVAHFQEHHHDNNNTEKEKLLAQWNFPIIGDPDRTVSKLYAMTDVATPGNLTIRSVFIIDPDNRLRLSLNYPASVGRNMDEIIRCVKSLQLSYQKSVATPANWPNNHPRVQLEDGTISTDWKGSVFLLPTVSTEQAFLNYPGYHTCKVPSQKKYLRLVKASHVGVAVHEQPSVNKSETDRSVATTSAESSEASSIASTAKSKNSTELFDNLLAEISGLENSIDLALEKVQNALQKTAVA
ncbi:1-Cys peroxiredoxin [Seminavis robusta]|uniref:1-Cys peroxiredoxin n=1 Tax=Seminavis robusta TaxID=568900 RepID=A0A9N8ERZ8_9STRA|nr:1-Cys peroxiredoxin [Seminavis robusta]|eukprot:Sro1933_g306210.1 1-Cys peroxiredoxin (420) ;mRNA; f:2134-3393